MFSKNGKSEIRSKNSKKMLEFSLKMIISRFFLMFRLFQVRLYTHGGAGADPPLFRTLEFFIFSSVAFITDGNASKTQRKIQKAAGDPPVTSPLDSWGGRSLLSISENHAE